MALAALALLVLVYVWFWIVAAHRIGEPPSYAGFAHVFVTGCGDFEHFYHGARAMREGRDLYSAGAHGYIYPPLIAFLFMPLTFLSVQTAALVMLVVNMSLVLWCTWIASTEVLRRLNIEMSPDNVILLATVTTLLSASLLRGELQMWQTNVLMMLALLLALRYLDSRPWLSGLLVGLAINVKYLPLVFVPYLLLRRRFTAAGWSMAGIVAFALLPAVHTGLGADLHALAVATSGLARLLGMNTADGPVANVDPITVGHSLSITSGLARVIGPSGAPWQTWLGVGAVALCAALMLRAVYVAHGRALIAWPRAVDQQVQPYRGTVALEWAALVTLALAFSPQTNPRHTSLLLIIYAPLAAMLCLPRAGVSRRPALWATAILFLGLALPPHTPEFAQASAWWGKVGGPGWCMLLSLPFFFTAGFAQIEGALGGKTIPGDAG
jgi:hypothetical protein